MQERTELGGSKRKTERAGNVLIRYPCQKTEEEERENKEKEKIEWTDRKKYFGGAATACEWLRVES